MRSTQVLPRDFKSALQRIGSLPSSPSFLRANCAQNGLHKRYHESKPRSRPEPIQQYLSNVLSLRPQLFRPHSKTWEVSRDAAGQCLERGHRLRIISWNIYFGRWAEERVSAALRYLRNTLENEATSTIIMLQEVRKGSLRAISNDPWVQLNFALSNADPPQSIFIDIPGEPFILKHLEWQAAPYFTVMLISKDLSIVNCFRAPFATKMGRVALVVDIPIANNDRSTPARECLRLYTTHLESLWDANGCRPNQLALISAILKGNPPSTYKIAAGHTTGRLSRLGLGLKTEVDAWKWIVSPWTVKGEKLVNKPVKEYLPLDFFPSDRVQSLLEQKELTRVKHVCWVSDYFSIAIGIRVS